MSTPPDKAREAFGRSNSKGSTNFDWQLTDSALTDLVKLVIPPNNVLPVIFVPGIMGSNLKNQKGEKVWRLDNGMFGAPTALAKKWIWRSAGTRQKAIHPDRVDVDAKGAIPAKRVGSISEIADYERRGWGEVSEGSYHDFLLWLEEALNKSNNPMLWGDFSFEQITPMPKPGQSSVRPMLPPGIAIRMRGLTGIAEKGKYMQPVMSDDLLKRAKFRMPVYACGYNWLASNKKAAERLQTKITQIIAENSRNGAKCEQVIVVTHSMGGLVTRCCALMPGMQDKIAGVVHGVMPAVGAAVAYRRCKVGMKEESRAAGLIIGSTGKEVTAVFAQAPGALQLLPTAEYCEQWLQVMDGSGKAVNIQPVNDPYDDIYLRRDRWWGLVRKEWLSPEDGEPIKWGTYEKNIEFARSFHQEISGKYHPETYVYYGIETDFPSFETIQWHIKSPVGPYYIAPKDRPTPQAVGRLGFGDVLDTGSNPGYVREHLDPEQLKGPYPGQPRTYWHLTCGMQDGGGDGTVPASSGRAPLEKSGANIRQQFRLSGFDHEGSFRNAGAQQASLYGLMKIAAEAKISV